MVDETLRAPVGKALLLKLIIFAGDEATHVRDEAAALLALLLYNGRHCPLPIRALWCV